MRRKLLQRSVQRAKLRALESKRGQRNSSTNSLIMQKQHFIGYRPIEETLSSGEEFIPHGKGWVGSFRMRAKRSYDERLKPLPKPVHMDHYNIEEENKMSLLALLAKKLVHTVRLLKDKDKHYRSWQSVISELRKEGEKLKEKRKLRKVLDQRLDLFKKTFDDGIDRSIAK
ncbi:hypothetical protein GCK32_018337, partial [Trichostrongylus colubriformis]